MKRISLFISMFVLLALSSVVTVSAAPVRTAPVKVAPSSYWNQSAPATINGEVWTGTPATALGMNW